LKLESKEPTDKPVEKPKEPLKLEEESTEEETEEAEVQEPRGWCTTFIFTTHPYTIDAAQPGRPAIEPDPTGFPLGDHMVVEAEGRLSCLKCGREASLTEADKFAETPCKTEKDAGKPTQTVPQTSRCVACTLPAVAEAPMLDPMSKAVKKKMMCGNCYNDYLRILRRSGPQVGRVRARAPPDGVWFSFGDSGYVLLQRMGGVWPCPACDEFFDSLYDVVAHFTEKHPEYANVTPEKVSIAGVETVKTFQGFVCPYCGFFAENERHLTYHVDHDHQTNLNGEKQ
jgi:hypothetical protein